jgi:hypothetical protein
LPDLQCEKQLGVRHLWRRDGVLVDAKHWADWPKDELPFSQTKVVAQGLKQIEAAQGVPVVWKFPNQFSSNAKLVAGYLRDAGIAIDVVWD